MQNKQGSILTKTLTTTLFFIMLLSMLSFAVFAAVFTDVGGGVVIANVSGTDGIGRNASEILLGNSSANWTIYTDTLFKFINGTVLFRINVNGSGGYTNITNVTLWFNRTSIGTGSGIFTFNISNYSASAVGQKFFNLSVGTTTMPDGNYSLNISAQSPDDTYWNNSAFNRTMGWFIVLNTVPNVTYAGDMLPDGRILDGDVYLSFYVNHSMAADIAESVVYVMIGNGTFVNITSYANYVNRTNILNPGGNQLRFLNFTNLGDGNYTYNVTVNTTVGIRSAATTIRSVVIDKISPTAVITASTGTTATLGSASKVTCTQTDKNPANVTLTRSDKTGNFCQTPGSSCSADITPDSYDSPTFTCIARDKAGHQKTVTFVFDRIDPPTAGTSAASGGGGGGGGSSSTTSITSVAAETTTTTPVNTPEVKEVTFTTNKQINDAKVTVSTSSVKPADVPSAPTEGNVFTYLTVNTVGFTNADLTKGSIKFAVTKVWLTEQKLTPADITLHVYRNNAWKVLKTGHASGDENSEYFIADTEGGFSTFAVVGASKEVTTQATTQTEEEKAAEEAQQTATQKKTNIVWLVVLLAVVALIVVYFIVKRRNK